MTSKIKTKTIAYISLFATLIVIGAFLSLPIGPVDISLQTFFLLLATYFIKEKASLSALTYILIGLMGLPVFAGFKSGFGIVLSPSFGFLIGMVLVPLFAGPRIRSLKNKTFKNILLIFIISSLLLYLVGLPYMTIILRIYMGLDISAYDLLLKGMIVFLPGDLLKAISAAWIVSRKNLKSIIL